MIGNNQVRFGEGPTEKDHPGGTSLAAYSTFGCTSSGDVITFVLERESCSFQDACERLSTRAPPPLLEASPRTAPKSTGRRWEELPADSPEAHVLDLALQVYQAELWRNARAQACLRLRAVPEGVARTQRLGYADGGALLRWLRQEARPDLLLAAADLGSIQERPSGEGEAPVYREFFVDRLIIAELRQGRPIWCIGRAIDDPPTQPAVAEKQVGGPPIPAVRPRPKCLGLPGEKPVIGWNKSSAGMSHISSKGRWTGSPPSPGSYRPSRSAGRISHRTPARARRGARDLWRLRPGPRWPQRRRALRSPLRQPLAAGAVVEQSGPGRARRPGRRRSRDLRHPRRACACRRLAAGARVGGMESCPHAKFTERLHSGVASMVTSTSARISSERYLSSVLAETRLWRSSRPPAANPSQPAAPRTCCPCLASCWRWHSARPT
jgi:hypothetical protein